MVINWKLLFGTCLVLVSCILVIAPSGAMGGPAPEKTPVEQVVMGDVYVITDFESGNLKSPVEWWTFDLKGLKVVANDSLTEGDQAVVSGVGKYSLQMKGEATNWYAGGAGAYIAKEGQDLSKFNSLKLDIYGNGEGSGTLKIELFDDDNNNWQVEQDPAKNYAATSDDKLVYDINVDWSGWQRVVVPLADFVDDNPGVGDDVWNPVVKDDSGGLLQIQLIGLAAAEKGTVNYNVDNISLSVSEE
ncbi:MAG: hypothetical protein KJ732_07095 [Candidatus Margulisbacteria bacterium]|nr:hypothetical protein [Candidatus Margulisiibacteriota bacterium]